MAHLVEIAVVGSHLTSSPISHRSSDGNAPPRKPRRPSEEADPADLVPQEYEEPSEDTSRGPGKPEFEEPSESPDDAGEMSEPVP